MTIDVYFDTFIFKMLFKLNMRHQFLVWTIFRWTFVLFILFTNFKMFHEISIRVMIFLAFMFKLKCIHHISKNSANCLGFKKIWFTFLVHACTNWFWSCLINFFFFSFLFGFNFFFFCFSLSFFSFSIFNLDFNFDFVIFLFIIFLLFSFGIFNLYFVIFLFIIFLLFLLSNLFNFLFLFNFLRSLYFCFSSLNSLDTPITIQPLTTLALLNWSDRNILASHTRKIILEIQLLSIRWLQLI